MREKASRKKNIKLEGYQEFISEILIRPDLDHVFNKISEYLNLHFGFESAGLALQSEDQQSYQFRKVYIVPHLEAMLKPLAFDYLGVVMPMDVKGGLIAQAIKSRSTFYQGDLRKLFLGEKYLRIVEKQKLRGFLIVPICIGEEVLGAFNLGTHTKAIKLSPKNLIDIEFFTAQIAPYLKNSQLYEKLEEKQTLLNVRVEQRTEALLRAKEELENLNEISRKISQSLDFDEVFKSIAHYLQESYGFECAGLALVSKDRKNYRFEKDLIPEKLCGVVHSYLGKSYPLSEEGGGLAFCIMNNKHFFFTDIDPSQIKIEANRDGIVKQQIKTILIMPVSAGEEIMGAFNLTTHTKTLYLKESEILSIQKFVYQIAISLKNSLLFQELNERNREIKKFNEITQNISENLELAVVFDKIVYYLKEEYGFEGCALGLINSTRTAYIIELANFPDELADAYAFYKGARFPMDAGGGRIAQCIKDRQTTFFTDIRPELIDNPVNREAVEKQKIKSVLNMPIVVDNEGIGALNITAHSRPVYLSADQIQSIGRFVNQISMVIQNSKVYDMLRRQKREVEELSVITRQISLNLNFKAVFENIFEFLKINFGFEGCLLVLCDQKKTQYKVEISRLPKELKSIEKVLEGIVVPIEEKGGLIGECLCQKSIQSIPNAQKAVDLSFMDRQAIIGQQIKSLYIVPVVIGEEVLGALSLSTHEEEKVLKEEDLQTIRRFVDQIAVLIRNAKIYQNLEQKNSEIENLAEIAKQINLTLKTEIVFDKILGFLAKTYGFEGGGLALVIPDGKHYRIEIMRYPKRLSHLEKIYTGLVIPLDERGGGVARCIRENERIFVSRLVTEEIENPVSREAIKAMQIKSIINIPITIEGQVIGAVSFYSHERHLELSEEDQESIYRFTSQISVIIRNSSLYEQLEREKSFTSGLLENAPMAIGVFDRQGVITLENLAMKQLMHDYEGILLGQNIFEFESIKNSPLHEIHQNAIQRGLIFQADKFPFHSEISNQDYFLNIRVSPLVKDGKTENVLVMFSDNTEKALVEKKLKEDLFLAKRLQRNLLASSKIHGENIELNVFFEPMQEVGGDIYDIFRMPGGRIRIFLADATGHGVQAALTTMIIKAEYEKIKNLVDGPEAILNQLNNSFYKNYYHLSVFFTAFLVDIEEEGQDICYASAGHPRQMILRKEGVDVFGETGKMVGLVENLNCRGHKAKLENGDVLLLFTDGIYEEFNAETQELGEDGLLAIVEKIEKKSGLAEVNQGILNEVSKWMNYGPYEDDVTLIAFMKKAAHKPARPKSF